MQMVEEVKRVKAFSPEELNNYIINAPDDGIHLPKKNIIIFGVSGFGRIEEVSSIMGPDVSFTNSDGVSVKLNRTGPSGEKHCYQFLITNSIYKEKVSIYWNSMTDDQKKGRLFGKVIKLNS